MKKICVILGICILLVGMPVAMPLKISAPQHRIGTQENTITHPKQTPVEDPPDWANGNFSGVWGTDIWGETQIPYCSSSGSNYFPQ